MCKILYHIITMNENTTVDDKDKNTDISIDTDKDKEFEEQLTRINLERHGYVVMNEQLLEDCKNNKKMLDMHYSDLYTYIIYIQTSVIILSTISAFIQALGSTIPISPNVQFISGLIISTYTSLVLSLSKFYKIDERKEGVHNLREKFAEIHQKIRYRLDCLRPWESRGYINKNNINKRIQEWETDKGFVTTDYFKVIEAKEKLFMDFEILIDSKMRNKYFVSYKLDEHKYIEELNKLTTKMIIPSDNTNDANYPENI